MISYPYTTVGVAPQDLKYKGERSETRIGRPNKIREFVTIHRGTEGGGMVTRIGDDNLLMAYVHIAHDVRDRESHAFSERRDSGGACACSGLGDDRRLYRSAPVLPRRQARDDRRL